MKRSGMTNVTFSLPVELNNALHTFVGKRGLSSFVARAIAQELKKERMSLKQEYLDAENDSARQETIAEWSDLELEGWK